MPKVRFARMNPPKSNWRPIDSSRNRPKSKRASLPEGDVHLALNTIGPSTAVELHTILATAARDELEIAPTLRNVRRALTAMQARGVVLAVVARGEAPRWRLRS